MSLTEILGKVICHGQKFLVYPSAFLDHPRYVSNPSYYGFKHEDIELRTSDGITLRCYLMRPAKSQSDSEPCKGSVIIFHGNAMNYGDCISGAVQIVKRGYTAFLLSYRGYAHSDGSPSEKGLQRDAQAALDYLLADDVLSKKPIILFGQSLGGAVAIDLASKNSSTISALIVENTFTSLPGVVRGWPVIGVFSFICSQKWNSASKIPRIPRTLPILMLSGDMDQVVPKKHMHDLWEIAKKRGQARKGTSQKIPKATEQADETPTKDVFKSFEYGTHTGTYNQRGYWPAIEEFMATIEPR